MTDHKISVVFDEKSAVSCTNVNPPRDYHIIQRMAEALVPRNHPLFPAAIQEAEKVYRLVAAMRIALEEECAAGTSMTQVD